MAELSVADFRGFQRLIYQEAGITLSDEKRVLVESRLSRRLTALGLEAFRDYLELLGNDAQANERDVVIDLLTTHETYFLREPPHFEHLAGLASSHGRRRPLRAWSAACSSGEEAYSIAMTLAGVLPAGSFEVLASDVSIAVLEQARRGLFPMERGRMLPQAWLKRYCRRGQEEYAGMFLVSPELKRVVSYQRINLDAPLPVQQIGQFDVIFLRNVMIYFNEQTRRETLSRVSAQLLPGGYLYVGHAEAIADPGRYGLIKSAPAIYRKAGA